MAQIFVSHSRRDSDLINLFSRAFGTTNVKAIWQEFEEAIQGRPASEKIEENIGLSNAVFVILSRNVDTLPHTRDWVVWEAACARNKDVWVFEPSEDLGQITVVIPVLRHYVQLGITSEYQQFLRQIIESYDDSQVLPTTILGGAGGALAGAALSKDRKKGAVSGAGMGALLGYLWSLSRMQKPQGLRFSCSNCYSSYQVHLSQRRFRCPVCNQNHEVID